MTLSKIIFPAILLVLTIAAGFWGSKTGKPYNTGIFTLHKLLALAAVILAVITISGLLKTPHTQTQSVFLIILAVLSVIALFATGAIMSVQKTVGSVWLLIHRIAPFILVGSASWLLALLLRH